MDGQRLRTPEVDALVVVLSSPHETSTTMKTAAAPRYRTDVDQRVPEWTMSLPLLSPVGTEPARNRFSDSEGEIMASTTPRATSARSTSKPSRW